jgi:hypothetical protein
MSKLKFDGTHIERYRTSGLSLSTYCREHDIKMSALQYHLAKELRQNFEPAVKFVPVSLPAKAEWFLLQIGSDGLRLKCNIDFRL